MKKYIIISIIIFLTGCNSTENNKLVCEKHNKENNQIITTSLEYLNNGKELQKVNIITSIPIDDKLIEITNTKDDCNQYINHQGITCKSEILNNLYTITIDYNLSNMTKEDIVKFDLENDQYISTKNNLEKQEYICK